jgi:prefoldin subunit 5
MLFDRVLISDLDSDIERLRAENAKIREQLDALDDLRRIGNRG